MTGRGTILFFLALALAPMAWAQKIRSAEDGAVPLAFDAFAPSQDAVTVKPGEAAWTEGVRPAMAARLLDATQKRARPVVEGVPAGTLLFGYRLSTGYAYCPALDVSKPWKNVQCYRDLDGDGTFDGSYATGEKDADNPYFSSFLRALTGTPKYRYERVAGSLLPPAAAQFIFVDMKGGTPRFRLKVGKDKLRNLIECKTQSVGECDVWGVRLAFAPASEGQGAITISFVGVAPDRTFGVVNDVDPLQR
jgi:hypothetical protein